MVFGTLILLKHFGAHSTVRGAQLATRREGQQPRRPPNQAFAALTLRSAITDATIIFFIFFSFEKDCYCCCFTYYKRLYIFSMPWTK